MSPVCARLSHMVGHRFVDGLCLVGHRHLSHPGREVSVPNHVAWCFRHSHAAVQGAREQSGSVIGFLAAALVPPRTLTLNPCCELCAPEGCMNQDLGIGVVILGIRVRRHRFVDGAASGQAHLSKCPHVISCPVWLSRDTHVEVHAQLVKA